MAARSQLGLFGGEAAGIDPSFSQLLRTELADGAWLDYAQGWLGGHEALLQELVASVRWRSEERTMYERTVQVPRLYATLPQDGPIPPLLERAREALSSHYGEAFERLSLGYYRDGRDSVAWQATTSLDACRALPSRRFRSVRRASFTSATKAESSA